MANLLRAGVQKAHAIVLSAKKTKKEDRWNVELQIIGGGVENVYPTLEEAQSHGIEIGKTMEVDVSFQPCGEGTEKRGEFTDRFTQYRMKVYLPRLDGEGAARKRATAGA